MTAHNPFAPRERAVHRYTCERWAEAARAAEMPALAQRFDGCGMGAWAYHDGAPVLSIENGAPVRQLVTCHHRNCPVCARTRSARIRATLEPAVETTFTAKPALLTLTIDDRIGESLKSATARLQGAWKKMRRRKGWADRVRGGFYALEVTRNQARGSWHVHLHAVIDVDWLGQSEALMLWRDALGAGEKCGGVNIQRVKSGISEATKYLTKGIEAAQLPLAERVEMLKWMHGRRMLATFGSLYGLKLADDDEGEDTEGPEMTGAEPIGRNARTGEVVTADDCEWSWSGDAHARGFALLASWYENPDGWQPPAELLAGRPPDIGQEKRGYSMGPFRRLEPKATETAREGLSDLARETRLPERKPHGTLIQPGEVEELQAKIQPPTQPRLPFRGPVRHYVLD